MSPEHDQFAATQAGARKAPIGPFIVVLLVGAALVTFMIMGGLLGGGGDPDHRPPPGEPPWDPETQIHGEPQGPPHEASRRANAG